MSKELKEIIYEICNVNGMPIKKVLENSLEDSGNTILQYGHTHQVLYYHVKKYNKTIYIEYDVLRRLARNVMVFDV